MEHTRYVETVASTCGVCVCVRVSGEKANTAKCEGREVSGGGGCSVVR